MNEEFGVESISSLLTAGPYRWGAHELRGYGVLTNRVGSGAYRGPGAPPAAFAVETLLDELAAALDIDPIELRLRNVLRRGRRGDRRHAVPGRSAPRSASSACATTRCGAGAADLPAGEGVGVAIGYWPGGLEPAAATCRLDADGKLTIITGAVDMSGTETTFGSIAAEAFGIAADDVRVVAGDTSSTPFAGLSGGSKVTYTVGRAVQRAADEARERLLQVAATELEIAPEDLEIVDGEVRPAGSPSRGDGDRRPGEEGADLRQPLRARRGLRRGRADEPGAVGRRASRRTCAWTARPAPSRCCARSSPRTSGAC